MPFWYLSISVTSHSKTARIANSFYLHVPCIVSNGINLKWAIPKTNNDCCYLGQSRSLLKIITYQKAENLFCYQQLETLCGKCGVNKCFRSFKVKETVRCVFISSVSNASFFLYHNLNEISIQFQADFFYKLMPATAKSNEVFISIYQMLAFCNSS